MFCGCHILHRLRSRQNQVTQELKFRDYDASTSQSILIRRILIGNLRSQVENQRCEETVLSGLNITIAGMILNLIYMISQSFLA